MPIKVWRGLASKENGGNTRFHRNDRKRKISVKSRFLQVTSYRNEPGNGKLPLHQEKWSCMTSAKIFKWERKTDELGGVSRGKKSVLTSVRMIVIIRWKRKTLTNGQRQDEEAAAGWRREEKCCTEKDVDRRSPIGRGRADKDGIPTETLLTSPTENKEAEGIYKIITERSGSEHQKIVYLEIRKRKK